MPSLNILTINQNYKKIITFYNFHFIHKILVNIYTKNVKFRYKEIPTTYIE